MNLQSLNTPTALIDVARMNHNILRMQQRLDALGVAFRPHVKTSKCRPVVQAQLTAGAQGITVSTLKEAEQFFAAGIHDIVYAVGIAPAKLPQALALRRAGCDLKLVADSLSGVNAIVAFGREHDEVFEVWIEIDVDGHRSGIPPEDAALLPVATALVNGGMRLGGVIAPLSNSGNNFELIVADRGQPRNSCVIPDNTKAIFRLFFRGAFCGRIPRRFYAKHTTRFRPSSWVCAQWKPKHHKDRLIRRFVSDASTLLETSTVALAFSGRHRVLL